MTVAPPSPEFIAARFRGGKQTPRAIVIHGTVSPCVDGGARAVAHDFVTTEKKKSAHYISDPHETIQSVRDHTVAFHCGFNQDTIGHELCDPQPRPDHDAERWDDPEHVAMLQEAALIDAQLCLAFGIEIRRPSIEELQANGPHGIYGHNDSRKAFGNTTHTDPGDTFPWHRYLALVQAKAAELAQPDTPVPTPSRQSTAGVINHRLVSANLFVKNKAPVEGVAAITGQVKATFRRPPDAIGVQEGHAMLPLLTKAQGYRLLVADGAGEAGKEIPILLNENRQLLGEEFHPAADGVPELGGAFDHPRGIFVVKYLKRGRKVALINTHMGVIGDEEKLQAASVLGKAATQHAEHAALVVQLCDLLRADGFLIFVTADANSRGIWSKSLPAMLKAAGMHLSRQGVDLVASDLPTKSSLAVPHTLTGSDVHDALAVRCTENRA